ncbi:hypothetical protein, partial [Erythrobacter sp. YJ-T3-07]|uniref:hypothetical protein n=1 Tax=Erythrobacter sp. YJ-T3-07 TaxID=2793063 RepID=UPI001F226D74
MSLPVQELLTPSCVSYRKASYKRLIGGLSLIASLFSLDQQSRRDGTLNVYNRWQLPRTSSFDVLSVVPLVLISPHLYLASYMLV